MTTERAELKPCPLCGGDARFENYIVEAAVFCARCRVTIIRRHAPCEDTGIAEAIAAWNTRTGATP